MSHLFSCNYFEWIFSEMKEEDHATTTSENVDPVNGNGHLSEGEDSADDKQTDVATTTTTTTTTAKKGATKRPAPSSATKTTGKKRSAEDEPFDDKTNEEDNENVEMNSEDGLYLSVLFYIDYLFL